MSAMQRVEVHLCSFCRADHSGPVTVADLRQVEERLVAAMTQAVNDGLDPIRQAISDDEAAQTAADARVAALLQQLADAATNPAPADPGAVNALVDQIKALTARDVANSTAGTTPPAPSA